MRPRLLLTVDGSKLIYLFITIVVCVVDGELNVLPQIPPRLESAGEPRLSLHLSLWVPMEPK